MLYSTHAERENVRYFQNMLFAKLYSLPFLMKPNHLGQKSGSPPIFLTLSHHPFHVDHKVLPVSFLNISKITPIFSILTVQDYITFSFRPLESLLRLHSASFSIPMPSTLYILASIALDFEYHQYTFWVYWVYDLGILTLWPGSAGFSFHSSLPTLYALHVHLLKFLSLIKHNLFSHTTLFFLFVMHLPLLFILPSNSCLYFKTLIYKTFYVLSPPWILLLIHVLPNPYMSLFTIVKFLPLRDIGKQDLIYLCVPMDHQMQPRIDTK